MHFKDVLLTLIIGIALYFVTKFHLELLTPIGGQAMSMPFMMIGAVTIVLLVLYTIILLCDVKLNKNWVRYIVIIVHLGIVAVAIKEISFYCKLANDPQLDKLYGSPFSPLEEGYWILGTLCAACLLYNVYRIYMSCKKQTNKHNKQAK